MADDPVVEDVAVLVVVAEPVEEEEVVAVVVYVSVADAVDVHVMVTDAEEEPETELEDDGEGVALTVAVALTVGHKVQTDALGDEQYPLSHGSHEDHPYCEKLPAGQGKQVDAPVVGLYVPGSHRSHN